MRFILFLFLSVASFTLNAQQVTGNITDTQGTPVNGATVTLLKSKDSAVIKFSVTNEKGTYVFNNVAEGSYRLNVTHVAHTPSYSPPFTVSSSSVSVPVVTLEKASAGMQDIVITARKPLVEVRADKMVLNVEGTINATGTDALELMRRSPGVTVDKDDNLSIAGKNGVQVYIDNRPTPMSGQDLANYLRSMQSSQIEAIEIITNPSAKYDAAGNAGIINIRLKKNKAFGTNGSATAGWQVGNNARYNGSLNLNHRNQDINIYGTYSAMKGTSTHEMNIFRTLSNQVFDQRGTMNMMPESHNFKVGADYTINKKSSIGTIINGMLTSPEVAGNSITAISNNGSLSNTLRAQNNNDMKRNSYNVNVNYNYNGTDGKSLVVNADKGYFDNNNIQFQPNYYFNNSGQQTSSIIYRMLSPTLININSVKADYEQNLGKGKLSLGGKIAIIDTDNDFQRFNVVNNNSILDKGRSNRFKYNENINAGYANYNHPFTGFMIQVGLRAEHTVSKGVSTGLKMVGSEYQESISDFKRSYVDFFPSAAITFNKNPMNQWSLNYSRRIDRPGYQDLNPFEFKLDEFNTQKGNINLQPQYTNSFGLSNTYKYKLTTSLNYSHVSNLFTQIIDTTEGNKTLMMKKNLATQDVVSMNVSYPFMYKKLTLFTNINANYSKYDADFGNNRKIQANAFGLSAMTQASIKIGDTWSAELTGFYNAPTIYQGTFKAQSMWMVEPGVQKQLFGGKANLKASVSDVFNTIQFRAKSDFAGQLVNFHMNPETRMFKLNFTYRFGSTTVKSAKQRSSGADDELKRAQGDGGGIGPVKQ